MDKICITHIMIQLPHPNHHHNHNHNIIDRWKNRWSSLRNDRMWYHHHHHLCRCRCRESHQPPPRNDRTVTEMVTSPPPRSIRPKKYKIYFVLKSVIPIVQPIRIAIRIAITIHYVHSKRGMIRTTTPRMILIRFHHRDRILRERLRHSPCVIGIIIIIIIILYWPLRSMRLKLNWMSYDVPGTYSPRHKNVPNNNI